MTKQPPVPTRSALESKYLSSRINLLLMIGMTVVNIVLLCLGNYTMMLFSATVPYFLPIFALGTEIPMAFVISLCISAVILLLYLLCFFLSKKHYGWMIAALVMFVLDTFAMIGLYLLAKDVSGIMDVLMHAWVIYYLFTGVLNGMKLKNMPKDEPTPEVFEAVAEEIKEEEQQ